MERPYRRCRFKGRGRQDDETLSPARMLQRGLGNEPAIGRDDDFQDFMPAMRTGLEWLVRSDSVARESRQLVKKTLPPHLTAENTKDGCPQMAFDRSMLLVINLRDTGTESDRPFKSAGSSGPSVNRRVEIYYHPDGHLNRSLTFGHDQPSLPRGLGPMNASQRVSLPESSRSRKISTLTDTVFAQKVVCCTLFSRI